MKKTLTLGAAILFACQVTNAQTQKGTRTLGLDLGYSSLKTEGSVADVNNNLVDQNQDRKNFNIGPTLGYFVCDGLEIGGGAIYSSGSLNEKQGVAGGGYLYSNTSVKGFNVSAFARKYVLYDNKVGFRIGPYIGYGRSKNKGVVNSPSFSIVQPDLNTDTYMAGVNLDMVYYPSKCLGLSLRLANANYNYRKQKYVDTEYSGSAENWGISAINRDLTLSVFYVLGKK